VRRRKGVVAACHSQQEGHHAGEEAGDGSGQEVPIVHQLAEEHKEQLAYLRGQHRREHHCE